MSVGWGGAGTAETYAATCARLCAGAHDGVLAALGPVAGRRVLDAGSGDGRLTARLVASGAAVTAVDADPAMVAATSAAAPTVTALAGALPDLPLPDAAYDAVVSAFVVNHLPDPRAGVAELARLARPGARVAITIWPSGANAQSRMWERVLASAGVTPAPGTRLPAEKDFPRTVDGLAELLRAAGLVEVESRALTWIHRGPVEELWRGAAGGVGGIGATVSAQSTEVLARLRAAYDVEVAPLVADGRLCFGTEAVLAIGTRPATMDP